MNDRIGDLLLHCVAMDFGKGELSKTESNFSRRFSNEVLSLCRSLPESAQTDAICFLMRYSGVNLGEEPDFFANYYPPAWSVLYWLSHDSTLPNERLNHEDLTNAVTAQSMAMLLHSLDDHLTDGQILVTPLTLLLRSQAWTIMNRAFSDLSESVPGGEATVRGFVDDYYSSAQSSEEPRSLNGYCEHFRRQMAIWMVAPMLLSMKMTGISGFTRDIEVAYGSFGIAWRLLDDIRDIGEDMEKGAESAIYLCLPKRLKTYWKNSRGGSQNGAEDYTNAILNHVLKHGLMERIKERICAELEAAASLVEAHSITGLAREFRFLAHPLRNSGSTEEKDNGGSEISLASK